MESTQAEARPPARATRSLPKLPRGTARTARRLPLRCERFPGRETGRISPGRSRTWPRAGSGSSSASWRGARRREAQPSSPSSPAGRQRSGSTRLARRGPGHPPAAVSGPSRGVTAARRDLASASRSWRITSRWPGASSTGILTGAFGDAEDASRRSARTPSGEEAMSSRPREFARSTVSGMRDDEGRRTDRLERRGERSRRDTSQIMQFCVGRGRRSARGLAAGYQMRDRGDYTLRKSATAHRGTPPSLEPARHATNLLPWCVGSERTRSFGAGYRGKPPSRREFVSLVLTMTNRAWVPPGGLESRGPGHGRTQRKATTRLAVNRLLDRLRAGASAGIAPQEVRGAPRSNPRVRDPGRSRGARGTLARAGAFLYKGHFPGGIAACDGCTPRIPSLPAPGASFAREAPRTTRRRFGRWRPPSSRTSAPGATWHSSSTRGASTGGAPRPRPTSCSGRDAFGRAFRSLAPEGRRALTLAARRIADFHRREQRRGGAGLPRPRAAPRSPRWSARSPGSASTSRAAPRATPRRSS